MLTTSSCGKFGLFFMLLKCFKLKNAKELKNKAKDLHHHVQCKCLFVKITVIKLVSKRSIVQESQGITFFVCQMWGKTTIIMLSFMSQ